MQYVLQAQPQARPADVSYSYHISDTGLSKLKDFMLNVQASVRNVEMKFGDLEKSIQEVKD